MSLIRYLYMLYLSCITVDHADLYTYQFFIRFMPVNITDLQQNT